ncbi:MAG TPA: penicillin-binding transpeptidase domain-containing protein [Acidimicrobiia bacterium]
MKFAVRLSILGVAFIVMFSVIGLRLWFVQVAEGPAIAQAATEQTWLIKTTHASRGDIYDRNNNLLVTSRLVPAVYIDRTFVQPDSQEQLIQRLSSILAIDPAVLTAMYDEAGTNGRFEVTTVDNEIAYQITEQLASLPGVEIVKVPERVYLSGDTMAHVIGHLGLPDAADIEERGDDLDPTIRIGKLGIEKFYDDVLQGTSGTYEYRVRQGEIIDERPAVAPVPGSSIVLTTDSDLQQVVELALEEGIALSNEVKAVDEANGEEIFSETKRAAAVVIDPQTFEVLALASVPDFDPQLFVTGVDDETFSSLNDSFAFNNLAVSGLYPPASTFKAITYTAIQEENLPFPSDIEGVDAENRQIHCDGQLELPNLNDGSQQVRPDWYAPANLGWLDIHGALENSCNVFFWSLGLGTWQNRETVGENVIQDWAKALGYGAPTGIDLANEAPGIVPTRELFEEWAEYQRENPEEPPRLDSSRLNPELVSPWFGGDLMDFAIGQGAFTATPLQAAVSYAVLANGGTVMEPRMVDKIIGPDGQLVEDVSSPVVREVEISEQTHSELMRDLNRVVTTGTAAAAFTEFGPGLDQVGGKTGTGQTSATKDNHAWFVGLAPIDDPKYVVAVIIDEGGSGGAIAAPVGRFILQYLMGNETTPIIAAPKAD